MFFLVDAEPPKRQDRGDLPSAATETIWAEGGPVELVAKKFQPGFAARR